MRTLSIALLLTAISLTATPTTRAQNAEQIADALAPFMDPQTIAIAHANLQDARLPTAIGELLQSAVAADEHQPSVAQVAAWAQAWLEQLRAAGVERLFIVLSVTDLREGGPFLVASFGEGANPAGIALLLGQNENALQPSSSPFPVVDHFGGRAVVAGRPKTVDRLKRQFRSGEPARVPPSLVTAIEDLGDLPLMLLVVPSDDHRRVIREMLPPLVWPLPGISGELIADGIVWAAVGIDPAGPAARAVVQSDSDVAAARLAEVVDIGLARLAHLPQLVQLVGDPAEALAALKPAQQADRLVWTIDARGNQITQVVHRLLAPPIVAARAAGQRSERMNRFRQIAIAMHNYHDVNKSFPPYAIRAADGTPLLSWRVALLPYLEGGELYLQFRLDEPWDSPHNLQLVEKMPEVFADPALPELAGEGKTTYQVPMHDETVFPPAGDGIPISQIKDGTSKTIMLVEAVPERAVPWTRPDDWQVDRQNPLEGVRRGDREAFTVALCDGSAHVFANDYDAETFWKLLTRAGGEPVRF